MRSAHGEQSNISEQAGLTVVLFGKTGNGKSSVGNIILGQGLGQGQGGQGHFPVSSGMASATVNTETRRTTRNGIPIEVIDIPDFINLGDGSDVITSKIISVKREVANKPYVILLAVRCDVRYTKEEYDIYKEFRDLWGRDISNHLIVAFTFGDRQERDLRKELKTVNPELKSVLKDAGMRFEVFEDNTDGNDKERQAERLMARIQELQRKAGPVTRQPQKMSEERTLCYGSMNRDNNRPTLTGVQEANRCCRCINCFFQRTFYMVCCCGCYPCCGCRPCCKCCEDCRRACRGDSCCACCRDSCCACCRDSCHACCRDSCRTCCGDSCCDCCGDSCRACCRDSFRACCGDSCCNC